jgi:hypothetical protein
VADGDVFAITVTDKAGGKWFLASFHGDTDGLATIPVTAAVRAQHKLLGDEYTCVAPRLSCSVLHHSLSLGLPPRMFRSPGRSAVFRKQIVVDTHARGGWVGGYGAHAGWCSVWMPTRTRRRQRASSWGTDGLAKHLGFRVWRAAPRSRPKAEARLVLEVSAGLASPSYRGLLGGDALLLSTLG